MCRGRGVGCDDAVCLCSHSSAYVGAAVSLVCVVRRASGCGCGSGMVRCEE